MDVGDIDRLIPLKDIPNHIRGSKPSIKTIRNWIDPGKGYTFTRASRVVVLKTIRIGHDRFTLPEWIEAFEADRIRLGLELAELPAAKKSRKRTATTARTDRRHAKAKLDRAGIT